MKKYIKKSMQLLCLFLVSPFYLLLILSEKVAGKDQFFVAFSQFFSLVPGLLGNYLRQQFYCLTLAECYDDCCIEFGTCINQSGVELGHRVYIGLNCCVGLCRIENDVMLGSNVDIISGTKQHNFEKLDVPMREQGGQFEKIIIGEDSWLGNSSVVMSNIGEKSIIAAGSVVTKDVKPFSIVGGNPAKTIRCRLDDRGFLENI